MTEGAKLTLESLDPGYVGLVKAYAKRFRMSPEEFLEIISQYPGETLLDKIEAYVQSLYGITVYGNVIDVVPVVRQTKSGDQFRVLRFSVRISKPDVETIKKIFGISDEAFPDVSKIFIPVDVPVSNKNVENKLLNIPMGSQVSISGFKVISGSDAGVYFFRGRGVVYEGMDYAFLDSIAKTVDELKKTSYNENEFFVVRVDNVLAVDPIYKSTSRGTPVIRLYIDDETMLDIIGARAVEYTKKLLGVDDPYQFNAWKDKTFYFGVFMGTPGDIVRMRVVKPSSIVLKKG